MYIVFLMYHALYMSIVFGVVYGFWIYSFIYICVLSFRKCIVLDMCTLFWIHVSCFRQMYCALDICIVF